MEFLRLLFVWRVWMICELGATNLLRAQSLSTGPLIRLSGLDSSLLSVVVDVFFMVAVNIVDSGPKAISAGLALRSERRPHCEAIKVKKIEQSCSSAESN
jgi:hypothetical protein